MITVSKKTKDSVHIGRNSELGMYYNLYVMKDPTNINHKIAVVSQYRNWLNTKIQQKHVKVCMELNRLYKIAKESDLVLGCHCAGKHCHGDVIKDILDKKLKELNKTTKEKK